MWRRRCPTGARRRDRRRGRRPTPRWSVGSRWRGLQRRHVARSGRHRYDGSVATQGFAACGAGIYATAAATESPTVPTGGPGQRPFSGVALLRDDGGNDHYVCASTKTTPTGSRLSPATARASLSACGRMRARASPGCSTSPGTTATPADCGCRVRPIGSLAGLIDRAGRDLYTSVEYSQGSGIHPRSRGFRWRRPRPLPDDAPWSGSGHDLAALAHRCGGQRRLPRSVHGPGRGADQRRQHLHRPAGRRHLFESVGSLDG